MQLLTISGHLGKDSEYRQTQSGDELLSFSVGVQQGYGDTASTNWYRCTIWGKRAGKLKLHLLKGVKIVAQGELAIGEYQGKPQFDVRVTEVEFMSRGENGPRAPSSPSHKGGSAWGAAEHDDADLDDAVPF